MEPATLTVTAGKLIFTGACLAVGFWAGKKLTNRIDQFMFEHSREFQELTERRRKKESLPEELDI